ncbi:MAG: protein-glutamine gamma-glutamyltransferase [Acidimicrobiaceae bacterium]|nr:protein-glutamine gamma-glutamyltransferase [Acidimicrobiaceae bacterium]
MIIRARPARPGAGVVAPLVVVGCGVAFGLTAGASLVFIAVGALATAFASGVVLAVTGTARTIVVTIDAPDVGIAGEPIALVVTSVASRRVVIDVGDGDHVAARWSPPLGRHRVSVEATFARRAVHAALPVTVYCAGPFGTWWWRRRTTVTLAHPLKIGPAVVPCAAPATGGEAGAGYAPTAAGRRQEPGAFHAVRPWSDGDSISWVHWPSALRTGELLVREWEPPAQERVEIVVDRSDDPEAAERATGRAAGEVEAALRAGRGVRLAVPTNGRISAASPITDRWGAAAVLAAADLPLRIPEASPAFRAPADERRGLPRALSVVSLWLAAGAVLGALGWPPVTTALALIGLPVVATLVHRAGARHPGALRAVTLAVVLGGVGRFVISFGDTGVASLGTLRDPLVELLLALATAHAASTLQRRSLRFSLGIGAALAFYAGAVRVDPAAAWWLAGWFVATLLALAAIHRSELAAVAPVDQLFPRADVRALATRSGWSVVRVVGAMVVALAVLTVVPIPAGPVQFVAPSSLPLRSPVPKPAALGARRPDGQVVVSGESVSGADDPATAAAFGYPAFEQSFDLSARGRPGHEVVMRVRAPAPDFWRGQTFERFDGRRWYVSDSEGEFVQGPVVPIGRLDGDVLNTPTDDMMQTYYIERDVPNLVFAAQRPVQLFLDAGVWVRPDGALRADTTLTAGTIYTVESRRSTVTADALRAQGSATSGPLQARWKSPALARYVQLSATTTDRTRELAHAITDPYPDVYDKVDAIERWLADNVEYDLDAPVPPAGADAVDHFLFESRRGFCEQISTALVVLLRSIGVPSREAAGYAAGQRDPVAGVWVVHGEDAHAWAEVWFPLTGWQAFDPTATVPLAGDSAGQGSLGAPIVRAIGRVAGQAAPYAIVPVAAAAAWPLFVWLARRRRARRSPAWAAQRRFERACRRAGVAVGRADSNEALASVVANRAPPVAAAAQQAGSAIDHAVFGAGDPDAAIAAVTAFEKALATRP